MHCLTIMDFCRFNMPVVCHILPYYSSFYCIIDSSLKPLLFTLLVKSYLVQIGFMSLTIVVCYRMCRLSVSTCCVLCAVILRGITCWSGCAFVAVVPTFPYWSMVIWFTGRCRLVACLNLNLFVPVLLSLSSRFVRIGLFTLGLLIDFDLLRVYTSTSPCWFGFANLSLGPLCVCTMW